MSPASSPGSAALVTAITDHGRVEGGLVKVDDFLNHQVDPILLDLIGQAIADAWRAVRPSLILTAEASGIPAALCVARILGIPMIYAKKYPRSTTERPAFVRRVVSPTKGAEYRVEVAHRVLPSDHRVLIVDDFLSGGRTAEALAEIVDEAGSHLLGFAFVIEKSFMEGRTRLEDRGWTVTSLVRVLNLDGGIRLDGGMTPITGPR